MNYLYVHVHQQLLFLDFMNVQLRQLISQQEVQIQQKLQKEVCTCITHYGPVATEVMCMTCHQETKFELSVGQATFIWCQ